MMTIRTRYLRLALVLGCAAPPATAQVTRDSAGIRIIDNAKPAWGPGREWRLSEKPTLDIGGGAGADYELGRIAGVTRLAGDSIAAEMPRMATIFAPSGAFVRNVQFGPFPEGALQIPMVMALGRFDNGTAVVMDYPQGQRGPAGARRWVDSSSLFLVDSAGAMVRPLGKAPVVVFVAGPTRPSPLDFGPQAPHASSGRAIYLGFSDQYAIRVYNSDWKLERIIRRAWTPRPLTGRDLDIYVDGWMQMWSKKTGAEREAERKEMRDATYPEFLPAYSAILATPSGEVWVREPDLTGAPGCWCLAGLSTVPSKWSVFDAGGRWLGDVPHAVMYRLDKPR